MRSFFFLNREHNPSVCLCVGMFSVGAEERRMVKNEGGEGVGVRQYYDELD